MKCEIERMEIIYTFYFFAFLKKMIKKLLTFCYWKDRQEHPCDRFRAAGGVYLPAVCGHDADR